MQKLLPACEYDIHIALCDAYKELKSSIMLIIAMKGSVHALKSC